MRKFTPGPWFAVPNPMRDDGMFVKDQVGNGVIPVQVSHANANLIAAAPEMLDALESVLQDFVDGYKAKNVQQEITIRQIHSVIAKARGLK